MPEFPAPRTGDVTWDGVGNYITQHIVYHKETEVLPEFAKLEDRVFDLEDDNRTFKVFMTEELKKREKAEKRREKILVSILVLLLPVCGKVVLDLLTHHF